MTDMRSNSNASVDQRPEMSTNFGASGNPTATSGSGVIPSLSAADIDFIAAQSGFGPSDNLPGAGSAANTTTPLSVTESSDATVNYELVYKDQLKKLEEMGFFNRQANLKGKFLKKKYILFKFYFD